MTIRGRFGLFNSPYLSLALLLAAPLFGSAQATGSPEEGGWKIASITNEVPTPERPIPEVLRGEG